MKKHLIVLSGNVGVGKSTIGSFLADRLNAAWLSESDVSSQFSYLFADETKHSRIISQINFATLRASTILSTFLSGKNIIVSERSLWDSRIFYEMWKDKFDLEEDDAFFEKLYDYLENHPLEYHEYTIWLKCSIDKLPERIKKRNEPFDHIHTMALINDLEQRYEDAFRRRPPEHVMPIDVTNLNILNQMELDEFLSSIINKIPFSTD